MRQDTSDYSVAETDALEEEIRQLKAKKPTLLDILIASPFDGKMDIDGKFTRNIFYKELYVEDEYEEHAKKLIQTIDDELKRNTTILISGYAGTGKSTFINTFINRTPSFAHHYLTFDERSIYHSPSSTDDEILNLIKKYLYDSKNISQTIAFLVKNRTELKANLLISEKLYKYTSTPRTLLPKHIIDVITEFDIKDTFTCFFCHLFLNLQENKITIIYFDNLDNVKLEFLSANFLDYFNKSLVDAKVLRNIGELAEKDISMSNFRFVFCLRDANGALANHHLASRTEFNNVVSFKVAFKPALCHGVLEKRIAFLRKVADEERFRGIPLGTISEFFKQLIGDSYFQKVFLPFFNKDYRTVVKALLKMLKETEDPEGLIKDLSYVSRGNLLFGLIKYALGEDFLNRYKETEIPSNGWCYIDRVVLTVIINRSRYNREKNQIGISESDLSESYQLVDCIQQLERFYSVEDILKAISRCFLYHERNWAHLLTISNVYLTRERQSHFIHETTNKYSNREKLDSQDRRTQGGNPVDRINLNNIRIRVNLAGFTFVRYILIHFEFYSNLVKNEYPLSIKESEINNPPKKFLFEDTIDEVINLVEFHIVSMEKFFDDKYKAVVGDKFYTSDYCFKHLGDANVALDQGYFHSTRIITSHINYIDRFRCEVPGKFKDASGETLIRVHKILIERIEKYIGLLRSSLDERGKNDFIADFEEAIHAVESALEKGDYKKAAEIKIIKKQSQPKKIVIKQLKPK